MRVAVMTLKYRMKKTQESVKEFNKICQELNAVIKEFSDQIKNASVEPIGQDISELVQLYQKK